MDLSALLGGAVAPAAPEEDEGSMSPDMEKEMLMKLIGKM